MKAIAHLWNHRRGIDSGFIGCDCIRAARSNRIPDVRSYRHQKEDPEIAISVITVLELAHGITHANTTQRRAGRQQFLDDLLAGMPVHPVTVAIALPGIIAKCRTLAVPTG